MDAVVFTRSLHHITALDRAVGKSRELLRPTGVLLVEDFANDEVDEPTMRWFKEVLGTRTGRDLIDPAPSCLAADLLDASDPMSIWRQHHHRHEVHAGSAMARAIAEEFVVRETRSVPYLYRYLVPMLPATPEAALFVEEVLREEARLAADGTVKLIGRRVVGSPH